MRKSLSLEEFIPIVSMKQSVAGFLSNMLSVILGIVITFTVQGMVDRSNERHEVRKALELVRSELVSNREEITSLKEYLDQEQVSARYLMENAELVKKMDRLDSLSAATVSYHLGIISADVSVVLLNDALELLKMSSLFQRIGDNALSMKIIRAYDCCSQMSAEIPRHVTQRDAQPQEERPRWIVRHDPRQFADDTDIDKAITAINVFLRKK